MKVFVLTVSVLLAALPVCAEMTIEDVRAKPAAVVEADLPAAHPSMYYIYALRSFEEGRKEDAVFWFYVGQLRYRFHLSANPDLPPDGDPALMASLNYGAGGVINEYAATDPATWAAQIDRALEWDAATRNDFTSKDRYPDQWEALRVGLLELRTLIAENAEGMNDEDETARRAEEREQRERGPDAAAQASTVRDIRSIGVGMQSWVVHQVIVGDQEAPIYEHPKTIDLTKYSRIAHEELERLLVPRFLPSLPENDGWGHPLEFYLDIDAPWTADVMVIRSPGRDGEFSVGVYGPPSHPRDELDDDIVWADGAMEVRVPSER